MKRALLLFFLFCLPGVAAFGVSPAALEFPEVIAGEEVTAELLLSSPFTEEWDVVIDADEWYAFSPSQPVVSLGAPVALQVTLRVPEDAPPGTFSDDIQFSYIPRDEAGEKRSLLQQQLFVPVRVDVASEAVVACVIGGLRFSPTVEGGESVLSYSIRNTGTASFSPTIETDIGDWSQDRVRPGGVLRGSRVVTVDFSPGRYLLLVEACGQREFVPLEVRSVVQLAGVVEEIVVNERNSSLKPVSAVFRNDGDTVVNARLAGTVVDAQDGRVLAVLDGDSVRVLPGQRVTLEEFIDLEEDFVVRARVLYAGESSEEFEVLYEQPEQADTLSLLPLFVAIIVILVFLIWRRK